MAAVVRGRLNKQVAFELGLTEITVKVHRGRLMRKMDATSLAKLVNMAARLGDTLTSKRWAVGVAQQLRPIARTISPAEKA